MMDSAPGNRVEVVRGEFLAPNGMSIYNDVSAEETRFDQKRRGNKSTDIDIKVALGGALSGNYCYSKDRGSAWY